MDHPKNYREAIILASIKTARATFATMKVIAD
jgi:hypothetical protein